MKVLIIDDEKSIRLSLRVALGKLGVKIFAVASGEEGIEIFRREKPDISIIDVNLPGINGIEVLKEIRKKDKNCIVIMITYISEVRLAVEAMKLGANDYFTKPFNMEEMKESIEDHLKYIKKSQELSDQGEENKTEIIGKSKSIQNVKEIAKKVGNMLYDTFILIQGESGTGKEIIAKAIHFNGIRRNKPYIALNCAAIPKNLQESELFGYEKGAFSDAKQQKKGLIEESNGGTLFLDEIGDMDIMLQAKLLRVLQEKKFRRIGGIKEIAFQANVIAATNKSLLKEIENGNFREDLYYRLNVVPIYTTPLRERREDIELLINYFISQYNKSLNKSVKGITKEALEICENYEWRGNVRELKNFVERVMIFQEDEWIDVENLPQNIISYESTKDSNAFIGSNLESVEMEMIHKTLQKNNWNISKTARDLGISRVTLRRKIEKYSIHK
ncbi:sigma-54-dependent Fis family transcriptional regulator [Crassaminicella thermophila]|uniref:Stage 0 sporulation protein A homolog n=1 Tax=Crassaminicella thermophila TaxID=2599308 RepID=A0A5C0SAX9_CRATE|nr:sigma-54 dependent transcriptional regulator [Crassaminicella thermophila]QEK11097.1 sigma-54-dependent Fis family transcriptional regulator [Crassaminicella thermophila]